MIKMDDKIKNHIDDQPAEDDKLKCITYSIKSDRYGEMIAGLRLEYYNGT